MPLQSWRIPGSFPGLLRRLGITQAPTSFDLTNAVVPVSLVDSDIVIPTSTLPPTFGTPASAGELVNPGAGARLADTGALAAGSWYFFLSCAYSASSGQIRVRRRNAADAADIWSVMFNCNSPSVGPSFRQDNLRFTVAQDERVVIEQVAAITATVQAAIFAVQVS